MTQDQKQKLMEVMKNNGKWPLILEGAKAEMLKGAVVLPANTSTENLGILPAEKDYVVPTWLKQLSQKSKRLKRVFLVIDGLENINGQDQEKFYGLFKYKGVNGYNLPDNVQILIPIKLGEVDKINDKLQALSITYKVN